MLLHNILTKIQRLLLKSTSSTIFFNFQCCISVTLTATAVVNHYVSKYPLMSHLITHLFLFYVPAQCVLCVEMCQKGKCRSVYGIHVTDTNLVLHTVHTACAPATAGLMLGTKQYFFGVWTEGECLGICCHNKIQQQNSTCDAVSKT